MRGRESGSTFYHFRTNRPGRRREGLIGIAGTGSTACAAPVPLLVALLPSLRHLHPVPAGTEPTHGVTGLLAGTDRTPWVRTAILLSSLVVLLPTAAAIGVLCLLLLCFRQFLSTQTEKKNNKVSNKNQSQAPKC